MYAVWLVDGYLRTRARLGFAVHANARATPSWADPAGDRDRGDVPGWVMVCVMTAALVVAILGVFRGRITDAVSNAIDSVTQAK
jgi:hypothetical protein